MYGRPVIMGAQAMVSGNPGVYRCISIYQYIVRYQVQLVVYGVVVPGSSFATTSGVCARKVVIKF